MTQDDGARGDQCGSTTVEVVLLAPVFFALLLFVVGLGRIADAHGQVVGAARDAARAASRASDPMTAAAAAHDTAAADLVGNTLSCTDLAVTTDTAAFTPGGVVRVSVRCTARLSDVALAGFPGHQTLTATAAAPVDTYRGLTP